MAIESVAMYVQTDPKYKKIPLGNGSGSIYDLGCYLVSLCNGLDDFGYAFTPELLNQHFKDLALWVGPSKNYIDVVQITIDPIFTSFQSIVPWNDMAQLKSLLLGNFVVLGRVDAKAIGGIGSHFVRVKSIEGVNAIIQDPWTGKTEPVSSRYGKYGNIFDLRVFGIKPATPIDPQSLLDYYHVKSADELKQMLDQQLAFLKDERDKNIQLQTVADQRKKEFDSFLEYLAGKLTTIVDVNEIKGALDRLLGVEEQLRVAQKALDEEKKKHAAEVAAMKEEITQLRSEIEKQQKENQTLLQRVNAVEEKANEQQKQKQVITRFQLFIKELSKLFERET